MRVGGRLEQQMTAETRRKLFEVRPVRSLRYGRDDKSERADSYPPALSPTGFLASAHIGPTSGRSTSSTTS